MKWLKDLLARSDGLVLDGAEHGVGLEEVGPGEVVVGELPEDLRRFQMLLHLMLDEFKPQVTELVAQIRFLRARRRTAESIAKMKEIQGKLDGFQRKMLSLSELIWVSLADVYPQTANADKVGIRKDWQVVIKSDGAEGEDGDGQCNCLGCRLDKALGGLGGVVVMSGRR